MPVRFSMTEGEKVHSRRSGYKMVANNMLTHRFCSAKQSSPWWLWLPPGGSSHFWGTYLFGETLLKVGGYQGGYSLSSDLTKINHELPQLLHLYTTDKDLFILKAFWAPAHTKHSEAFEAAFKIALVKPTFKNIIYTTESEEITEVTLKVTPAREREHVF